MAFAAHGDVRLFYDILGEPDAPAVLLLAGAGRQAIDFPDAFCAALVDRGYRVLRFDQRDTGLSTAFAHVAADLVRVAEAVAAGHPPALAYDVSAMAGDALAVLDAAGVARAHLFGRSLGGLIAQWLALETPDRVLSLTLAMAFSRAIGRSMPVDRLRQLETECFVTADAYANRQVATARALGNPDYFDADAIRAAALRAFERGVPDGSIARHFAVGLAAPDLRDRLAALRLPVQVIHGPLDAVIPIDMARETAAAIPSAQLAILDDMAHEGPPQLWERWIAMFAANAERQTIEKT